MDAETNLIGKCGFYCGSCPTYAAGECAGCRSAHQPGDCFTFDCVDRQGVPYCGLCSRFPCGELFRREKATVLDRAWLEWKKRQREGR
ncbi:MAG: DUF3795 domain-containing protein [Candidatus Aphodomorpha sp.]|nr:DUF3795 domain-containing protein [bacterium]